MAFKHKKLQYENISAWANGGPGNCFYCKGDRPELALVLIGEDKGICKECLAGFEIGNLAADRHVVMNIIPGFKDYKTAVNWFQQHGTIEVDDTVTTSSSKTYLCNFLSMDGIETRVEIEEDGFIHIIY